MHVTVETTEPTEPMEPMETDTTGAPENPGHRGAPLLSPNPIVVRDLRSRMRGTRAFIVITAYLSALACLVMILYLTVYTSSAVTSHSGSPIGPVMGKTVFSGLILLELALVCFIAPAFTAGSIAGERERQTYDLLRTTLLRSHSIVLGKLFSALAYIVLLIFAAIPLASIAFMFGGVALSELIIASVALVVTAVAFGAVGMFFSSMTGSTLASTVMTYAAVLVVLFGIPMLEVFSLILFGTVIEDPFSLDSFFLQLIVIYVFGFMACTNPIITAVMTKLLIEEGKGLFFFTETIDSHTIYLVNPWLVYVVFYTIISIALIIITIVKVSMRDKT